MTKEEFKAATKRRSVMNPNELKGNWNVVKGKIKETWGDLTDDEITQIGGKKDQLIGTLQKKYGYTREVAEQHVEKFEESISE